MEEDPGEARKPKKNAVRRRPRKKEEGITASPLDAPIQEEGQQSQKRIRVRRRPNLKQFLLENSGELTHQVPNNHRNINSAIGVKEKFKDIKNDILKLQALYLQFNNLRIAPPAASAPSTSGADQEKRDCKEKDKENKRNKEKLYENYVAIGKVTEGLRNGTFIEGGIRINARCFQQAYVSHPDKKQKDIFINGIKNRNRALEDDVVIIELVPGDEDDDRLYGKVVFIKQQVHPRISTGTLKLDASEKQPGAKFCPRDKRFPMLFIPLIDCPQNFKIEHKQYESSLFSAKIVKWVNTRHIVGTIIVNIGQSSDLKAQTQAILIENELNFAPYGTEFQYLYPSVDDCVIPEEEIAKREDFRNICVFTIDPATARDLDDAMSCQKLENGNYEVGVHISDVTYYLTEGTALDKEVAKRATTVYLVDGTYHMLPKDLCFHCSLLPGADKLTFSVVWELSPDGDIVSQRFTRGVINSCCQLAYEHVQYMIDNPDKQLLEQDYPSILNQWSIANVKETIDILHKLAVQFRDKRFKSGALRIDQPKIWFKLDPTNGNPLTFKIEEHNESHKLIEEFMLLANCTVAKKIFGDFPTLAFLRLHPPPKNTLDAVVENFVHLGIDLDVSSAGHLHASLAKHLEDEDQCRVFVLQAHLIKTLSRAKYFCAYGYDDEEIRHYALNIPLYTHFTSPIRRYADIVVHRLLASTLGYSARPRWTSSEVQKIADNCNKQKYNAKKANDMSCDLYLYKYISIYSPLYEEAAVMEIFDNAIGVIIFSSGCIRRIYFEKFSDFETQVDVVRNIDTPSKVVVKWGTNPQTIQTYAVFDKISVVIEKTDDLLVCITKVVAPFACKANNDGNKLL